MESSDGLIEVRIARIEQLFNSFDPLPFDERDLYDDAESHIAGWARELPRDAPIRLLVHMPKEEAQRAKERGLDKSIRASPIRGCITRLSRRTSGIAVNWMKPA
jgi:hypothetical protein